MKEILDLEGYDWSAHEGPNVPLREKRSHIEINDEALRDGQQALVETEPSEEAKGIYIRATSLFAEKIDLGYPGSSDEIKPEIARLAKLIRDEDIDIKPMVTGRGPSTEDVSAILDVANELDGYGLEAYIFLDVSRQRARHEGWNREELVDQFVENTKLLVSHNIPVGVVLERWSKTSPDDQEGFIERVLSEGASILVLADTQGVHNEASLKNELRWTFGKFATKFPELQFDAHFHNQRGLAVANSLIAAAEGVDRIHATPGGIGEGAGNTDYVVLLVNLNIDGYRTDKLKGAIGDLKDTYGLFGINVPKNAPFHSGAFETASGVHQSTLYKSAQELKAVNLYFCIAPEEVDEITTILLNRLSGRGGVKYVLEIQEGLTVNDEMIQAVLKRAKSGRSVLSREAILDEALRYNISKD